ncbi:hypothetical protein [uncultured Gimesia sp.]|uniref:hypothetical protein n=1 Tax=uncultured Gimesia sp. TaxID=1678688 RepID=UPI00262E0940|nr:hypothetical protein [uncultured Gimesia sp.]
MTNLNNFQRFHLSTVWLMFLCLIMVGCGGVENVKQRGSVTLTITHNGAPVTEGEVRMMITGKGEAAIGNLNESGQVELTDVVLGKYVVTVAPPELATPDNPAPKKDYPNLPSQYRDLSKSPLKAEVKAGSNEFTFDLKD